MSVVTLILVFLMAVIASVFISRLLGDKIPLPFIQIAAGAGLSLFGFDVAFEPHLFLFLFIPPLLFLDGWRIPKEALFSDIKPVMSLAIGLVFFTVVGMGVFIHWLIPAVSLAAAFALAAILSPTDPVSVSAMTVNSPLPPRMAHILEGESLFNDASGLVCFSFAVAATLTGTFSLPEATGKFVLVAVGGVVIGLLVSMIIGKVNQFLVKRTGEDPAIQIMISLIIPFVAYLVAEHLGVSGILAAVAAGIAMHYERIVGRMQSSTRMQSKAVWDTVQTALNGMIFILLGEQLPSLLRALPDVAADAGTSGPWMLLLYIAVITLGLGVLRFAWVWVAMTLTVFRQKRKGQPQTMPRLHLRLMAIMATAGVRGAITLAGILTLPLLMNDGTAFPHRDLLICIAMGVILFSLLIAAVALPILTRGLSTDLPHSDEDLDVRFALNEAMMKSLQRQMAEPLEDIDQMTLRSEIGTHLLEIHNLNRTLSADGTTTNHQWREIIRTERQMSLIALQDTRDALKQLRKNRSISEHTYTHLVHELDLKEESLKLILH